MTLADERLKELDNPSLTSEERILLRCHVAADLIHKGQYEAAREALGDLWRGLGQHPHVEGLAAGIAAEVLRQAGALSGWLGSSRQAEGAQEAAKDLISESAALFERIGDRAKAALAHSDLALCYWREGAYDEARVLLARSFDELEEKGQRAKVLLRWVTVEFSAGRYNDALNILKENAPAFGEDVSHVLRGSYHNHLALVLKELGLAEGRPDYLDRAIVEFTAAIYYYEQARHERYKATNENNLAYLLSRLGRHGEAHTHLDRARSTLTRLHDAGLLAQVDETRARVLLAEKKYREANRVIAGVIQTLEKGGEQALLADALTVQGVVWARMGLHDSSLKILRRALKAAVNSGATSNAAHAALTLIEEHGQSRLSEGDLYHAYRGADEWLKDTQDAEDIKRLRACARMVIRRLAGAELGDPKFSLKKAVLAYEGSFIERALEYAQGSVTRAARLLGISYQTLVTFLNTRHRALLKKRTPAKKRRRSIIKKK